jgi:putative endonuclease
MNKKGERGESIALKFLQGKGYELIETNSQCRYGELDLVMRDGEYLVFVEVKQRKDARFAQAREFITRSKQEKLRRAALFYLSQHTTELSPRFDVVEVYTGGQPRTEHIINAF